MNYKLNIKKILLLGLTGCLFSKLVYADQITVKLADPSWTFELKNGPHSAQFNDRRNKISRDESKFIHSIQPALSAKEYNKVIAEFDKFTAETNGEFSPSLNELLGQVLLSAKQYDKAEQTLLTAVNTLPNSAIAHSSLSMVYMIKQDYKNAQRHLVKTIELGQIDAQVYGQLAYVNLQLGLPVTAISGYQNALMLEPENKQWYQGLLYAYIASDSVAQANNIIEEMLTSEPDNKQLWLQRGQIALKQGNPKKAISSLETAHSIAGSDLDNLITLAKLHITDGSSARAVEIVSQNIKTFTASKNEQAFATLSSIASYLSAKQNWTELSQLVKAVKQQKLTASQQVEFNITEAKLVLSQNNTKQARRLLEQALDKNPASGEALLMLAGIHRNADNSDKANIYYVRAEALPKYQETARLGRAQIAINQKNYQQALDILRKVYQSNPARSDLVANIKSLENLLKNTG
ncbi:tetratricopeptide repeat protein [Catenovulum sp. 2E275]|uniref:tetratricopeptide repeat protein n=1 Tax=Catenovulum sp. 2E275 TaxID=2980497 RepID=UPI0021D03A76|nr:tetratricopeptide repeat protein [Catenovulum sp. 2E275]MCU4676533.1 tetratricopeptide repeat protein [Catenovulum sp. 2E275]